MSEIITQDQPMPVCPHCGHVNEDTWALDALCDSFDMNCQSPLCGKLFHVTRTFVARYDTEIPQ